MLPVDGRVIMVSGANRGIGLSVASALHARGYRLSLGGRNPHDLEAATKDFDPEGVLRCYYEATDRTAPGNWVEATMSYFGRIDGLVNAAGILRHATVETEDDSVFEELWQVNVMGPVRLTRAALPHLKKSGIGRVINLASMSGKRVPSTSAGYAMSKFAVVAFSHATRRLAWDDGVRVTAICPGYVATDMTVDVKEMPAEQMSQPEDIAELVATALALPNSSSVAEVLVNCRQESFF